MPIPGVDEEHQDALGDLLADDVPGDVDSLTGTVDRRVVGVGRIGVANDRDE